MHNNRLYQNRFTIAVLSILVVLASIVVTLVAYINSWLTLDLARLIVAGLASIGPISLSILTFLTLIDNQVLITERLKERERPAHEIVLQEVVQSAMESIKHNRYLIGGYHFDWYAFYTGDFFSVGIESIRALPNGSTSAELFKQNYPEYDEKLEQHTELRRELFEYAHDLIEVIHTPVSNYISSNDVYDSTGSKPEVETVVNHILSRNSPPSSETPMWWDEHYDDIHYLVAKEAPDEYSKFDTCLETYIENCDELFDSLADLKTEIVVQYGVSVNNNDT